MSSSTSEAYKKISLSTTAASLSVNAETYYNIRIAMSSGKAMNAEALIQIKSEATAPISINAESYIKIVR